MPWAFTKGILRPPGIRGRVGDLGEEQLGIQLVLVIVGLDDQRVGGQDAHTPKVGHKAVEVGHIVFIIDGAFFFGRVKDHDHLVDKVGRGKRAAVVPLDRLVEVVGIVDHRLDVGRGAIRIDFVGSDESLFGRVPVNPGIGRNRDLRLEFQVDPVQGTGHGQTFPGDDLGPLDALGPGQTGVGVVDHTMVAARTLHGGVIDPVTALDRVPGIDHDAGLGDAHRAALLTLPLDGVGVQHGTGNRARQVIGNRHVCFARCKGQGGDQVDFCRILH